MALCATPMVAKTGSSKPATRNQWPGVSGSSGKPALLSWAGNPLRKWHLTGQQQAALCRTGEQHSGLRPVMITVAPIAVSCFTNSKPIPAVPPVRVSCCFLNPYCCYLLTAKFRHNQKTDVVKSLIVVARRIDGCDFTTSNADQGS